jgi:hypothetical protein
MQAKLLVVFVHGWSVTNTDTYGGLPVRLRNEAEVRGIDIHIEEIFLGRYISFHNEVYLSDISRAFHTAVEEQLSSFLNSGIRFACITHSTGGPIIRDWWHRYYETAPGDKTCPMSHLVMLAPANYGSALAQLGKGRLSRLKFWFGGVEPGQGVLDWLELGSQESWEFNKEWILSDDNRIGSDGVFPFVLTGQTIDRALYDNLNSYTGELGSDGVVRVAAANLCGTYIKLEQEAPKSSGTGKFVANELIIKIDKEAPKTAMRVISGKSHSGNKMGIMRSVKENMDDLESSETVNALISCLQIKSKEQYKKLCDQFFSETENVQKNELLETEKHFLLTPDYFIHDRFSMVIFRVLDDEDHPVLDYELILTAGKAGKKNSPNYLPRGFFADRQQNHLNKESITYYFNHDIMMGTDAVKDQNGKIIREAVKGAVSLGLRIIPQPKIGFVHYLPCEILSSKTILQKVLKPNATTLIEIRLRRIVHKNVFRIKKITNENRPLSFKNTKPDNEIV